MWEKKIQSSPEVILLMKTSEEKKDSLIQHIQTTHPYEVPEITILQAEASEEYTKWLHNSI